MSCLKTPTRIITTYWIICAQIFKICGRIWWEPIVRVPIGSHLTKYVVREVSSIAWVLGTSSTAGTYIWRAEQGRAVTTRINHCISSFIVESPFFRIHKFVTQGTFAGVLMRVLPLFRLWGGRKSICRRRVGSSFRSRNCLQVPFLVLSRGDSIASYWYWGLWRVPRIIQIFKSIAGQNYSDYLENQRIWQKVMLPGIKKHVRPFW